MKVIIVAICWISCLTIHASKDVINNLLSAVKSNSIEISIAEQNQKASFFDLKSRRSVFSSTGYVRGSYSNQDTPPTSPFAPSNALVKEYELGFEKQWVSGIKTNVNYLIENSQITFPGRSDFSFIAPTLQFQVETSLIQDLFYDRFRHTLAAIDKEEHFITIETKVAKKKTLAQSLVDYSSLLEQREEIVLQKELCTKTKAQSQNLGNKRKRGTVSKREYLLGLKELENCQATIELLGRKFLENKNAFEAKYSVSYSDFSTSKIDELYKEARNAFLSFEKRPEGVNIANQDDLKSIDLQLDVLKSRQLELDALTKTNVALELRSGLAGIDSSLSQAQEDIVGTEYPFVYVGVRLDFPFKNRQSIQEANANMYRLKSLKQQKLLTKIKKETRFKTLKKTLEKDFNIYNKYKKSVNLSKRVYLEANKDFRNGRLDFNTLNEFNKGVVLDQKILASHRIQLIVRIVEYLDFFQFFEKYLEE